MAIDERKFIEEISSLQSLYLEVKEAIILTENLDDSGLTYLHPINEMRNVLDHIMRSIPLPSNEIEKEFNEAREHLNRAGNDVYQICVTNLEKKIINDLKRFSPELISTIFPRWYSVLRPQLIEIQQEVAAIRANKNSSLNQTTTFSRYFAQIKSLVAISKEVSVNVPEINRHSKRKRNLHILEVIGVAVLSIFGTNYVEHHFNSSTIKNDPPQSVNTSDTLKKHNDSTTVNSYKEKKQAKIN